MGSKAQISAEFFVLMGIAFLIAIAFEFSALDQLNEFRRQKEDEAVKDLAFKLQKELFIAASVEDGYIRIFKIPNKLDNFNYTIFTENSTVTVQSEHTLYIVGTPIAIGNFTNGTNKINKTGGVIHIN